MDHHSISKSTRGQAAASTTRSRNMPFSSSPIGVRPPSASVAHLITKSRAIYDGFPTYMNHSVIDLDDDQPRFRIAHQDGDHIRAPARSVIH